MRMVFTLYELAMPELDGEDVPRPRHRAVFGCPESGRLVEAWVSASASGGRVLSVLWGDEVVEDDSEPR